MCAFWLGCVSWCVSLLVGSVCFCSFLRREGKFNLTINQVVT